MKAPSVHTPNSDAILRRKTIVRWIVVAVLSIAILGALFASYRFTQDRTAGLSDELLAFELTGAHPSLEITIPGEIPEIELTTWAGTPPMGELDPGRIFRYAFKVTFYSRAGVKLLERMFEPETKITIDPAAPAYRIFGEPDWIADARTVSIPLGPTMKAGGSAKIELLSSDLKSVLIRPIHRVERNQYERIAFEKAFTTDTMQRLARGRQSLGFADLPPPQREHFLSRWGRRLDATGKEKVDFFMRRLLLSENTKRPRIAPSQMPQVVTDQHWIALNLHTAARLEVEASSEFEVVTHRNVALRATRKDSGLGPSRWILRDSLNQPHSLFFRAPKGSPPVSLRVTLSPEDVGRAIPPLVVPALANEIEVVPNLQRHGHVMLDPLQPTRFHVPQGQDLLRLEIRGIATHPLGEALEDAVVLRWKRAGKEERREARIRLMRSPFETLIEKGTLGEGTPATFAYPIQLRIPAGVTELEVLGKNNLFAKASVIDPFQKEDILQRPYRAALEEDEAWRFAPYEVHRWVPVRPDNLDELTRANRMRLLVGQTRIELKGAFISGKRGGPERPLAAVGNPYARHFFEPGLLSPGNALPQDGWTVFHGETRLRVEGKGPRGSELVVRYASTPAMLGKEIQWQLDKENIRTTQVSLRSGELRIPAAPGFHRLGSDARQEDLVAWVNAAPAQEGTIVRERVVYETTSAQDVGFQVDRRSDKPTTLALTIVTADLQTPYVLSYILDGGRPRTAVGVPFHRATEPIGILRGSPGPGGGSFVDGASDLFQSSLLQRGISKAKIRLGDDLEKGLHEIRFRSLTAGKTWVRLTLIGETDDTFASASHAWLDDE